MALGNKLKQELVKAEQNNKMSKSKRFLQNVKKKTEQKVKTQIERGFSDFIIISELNPLYHIFEVLITMLCLVSSYIYAYIAAFRLHQDMNQTAYKLSYIFETMFLIDLILNFFVEYQPEDSKHPVRDMSKIAVHYLQGEFKMDAIPLIPFQFMTMKNNRDSLFFTIKWIRLIKGFKLINIAKIKKLAKQKI